MTTHPHRIDPIETNERRRSRNCLRVDYISDGISPRCNLRPLDEQGRWVLDNRPYHLREMILCFDYCISAEGCDTCRIYQKAIQPPDPLFLHVTIRVRRERGRFQVITLGSCAWYDLYTGVDINAVAAWVKAHGGALGAVREDELHGRFREGFVNWHQIPEELRPPRLITQ